MVIIVLHICLVASTVDKSSGSFKFLVCFQLINQSIESKQVHNRLRLVGVIFYVQYPIQLPLKSHILFCLLCYSSSSVTLSVATTNEGRICSISPESVLSPSMPNNGLLNNSPFF
jgi:hypothetical protein